MISRSAVGDRMLRSFSFRSNASLNRQSRAEPQDDRAPSAGAKSLAIPFDQEHWDAIIPGETKCPACGKDSKRWTLFGRSY